MILLTLLLVINYATNTKTIHCIAFTNPGVYFVKHYCLHQTACYNITIATCL